MADQHVDLSIVITLYNRRELGLRALKSAISQSINTKLNVEIIVVDDGSNDNPLEIIDKYISHFHIKYFYKDNGGPASAKNFGAKKASGKFVFFLDSDDYLDGENSLEELPKLIRYNPDLIAGRSIIIKKGATETIKNIVIPRDMYNNCLEYPLNYVGVPPYIFKRTHFLKCGGLNEHHKWGDAISFWRIFTKDAQILYLNQPAYVYDQTSEISVSRTKEKSFYNKVLITISETYETSKTEIDLQGYTFNWGVVILALSIITFNKKHFSFWAYRCLLSPIKSTRALIYIIKKRL